MARTVQCVYLKKEAEGMDFPVYPGELGKRIYENVSKEAWAAWMKHQTMLVNENRLNLADQRARQYLARQMEQFFFGGGAETPAVYVPPPACFPRGGAARDAPPLPGLGHFPPTPRGLPSPIRATADTIFDRPALKSLGNAGQPENRAFTPLR